MPKLNCWVGCIAYIKAPYHHEARGTLVTVLRPSRDSEYLKGHHFEKDPGEGPGWVVESIGRPIKLLHEEVPIAAICDECLFPITPPPGARTPDPVEIENHTHEPATF